MYSSGILKRRLFLLSISNLKLSEKERKLNWRVMNNSSIYLFPVSRIHNIFLKGIQIKITSDSIIRDFTEVEDLSVHGKIALKVWGKYTPTDGEISLIRDLISTSSQFQRIRNKIKYQKRIR